jgi:large subunit ribosomal protein L9
MRVIFLQDVPNVARAGEIKEVADGYGRNFLIPKKLALLANPQAISQTETRDKIKTRINAELMELASQLEGKEVSLKAKAGAKDRLYGSITSADIATELNNTTGLDIDKRKIELEEPIRQLGSYEVAIRLAGDIVPKIKVTVTEEEAPKAEEKPPKKEKKAAKKEKKTPKAEKKAPKAEKKAPKKEKKTPKAEEKPPKKEKKAAKKEEKAPKAEKKAPKKEKKAPKKEKKTPKKKERT